MIVGTRQRHDALVRRPFADANATGTTVGLRRKCLKTAREPLSIPTVGRMTDGSRRIGRSTPVSAAIVGCPALLHFPCLRLPSKLVVMADHSFATDRTDKKASQLPPTKAWGLAGRRSSTLPAPSYCLVEGHHESERMAVSRV